MKRMITTMTMTALMVSGFATTGIEKVEAATTYKVKVTADGLRVRTGPSTAYKVVGSVNSGQTFNYLGVSGSWTKISYGGTSRYISSTYAKKYSVTTSTKASSGFSRPASGRIAQGYGAASGTYGYTFHNGIDIAAPTGTPVYASAAGTVITSRYYGAYGNHIMMKHTVNGISYTTVYAHLSTTGFISGISFEFKGTNYKGSYVHKKLSWNKIKIKLNNYEQIRNHSIIPEVTTGNRANEKSESIDPEVTIGTRANEKNAVGTFNSTERNRKESNAQPKLNLEENSGNKITNKPKFRFR